MLDVDNRPELSVNTGLLSAVSKQRLVQDDKQLISSYSALDTSIKDENQLRDLLNTYSCFPSKVCDIIISFLPDQEQLNNHVGKVICFNPLAYDKYSKFDLMLFLFNNLIHYMIASILLFIQNSKNNKFEKFLHHFICPSTISRKSQCNLNSVIASNVKWIFLVVSIIETLLVVGMYVYGYFKYRYHVSSTLRLEIIYIRFSQTLHQAMDIFIHLPMIILIYVVHNHILAVMFLSAYFILSLYETLLFQYRVKNQNRYRANPFFSSFWNFTLLIIYGIQYQSVTITILACCSLFCCLTVIIWFNKFLQKLTYLRGDVIYFVMNVIIHYIVCLLILSSVKWIFVSFTIIETFTLFIPFTIAGWKELHLTHTDFNEDDYFVYLYMFHMVTDLLTIPFVILLFIIQNEYLTIIFFCSYFAFSLYKTAIFMLHGDDIIIHQFSFSFWNLILFIIYAIIYQSIKMTILASIGLASSIMVVILLNNFFVDDAFAKMDVVLFVINNVIHYVVCFLMFLCPQSILLTSQCNAEASSIKWWLLSFALLESALMFTLSVCKYKISSLNMTGIWDKSRIIVEIVINIPLIAFLFVISNEYLTIIFYAAYFALSIYSVILVLRENISIWHLVFPFWFLTICIIYGIVYQSVKVTIFGCCGYAFFICGVTIFSDFMDSKLVKQDVIAYTISNVIHYMICFLMFSCPNSILSDSQCNIKSSTIKW
eukprot:503923_1